MRPVIVLAGVLVWLAATTPASTGADPAGPGVAIQTPRVNPDTWQIPPGATEETNPIAPGDLVLARGRDIYRRSCQRCHGPDGRGDGPDADPDFRPGDLSDQARAAKNPDGVLFYKIWNGRRKPRMPAFKTDLSKEDVWTVVHYVKTLRE
jgi:mono/diheme cytochrome c family protein